MVSLTTIRMALQRALAAERDEQRRKEIGRAIAAIRRAEARATVQSGDVLHYSEQNT